MEHLLFITAQILSKEDLIKEIQENTTKYLIDPSEENYQKIKVNCLLLLTKERIDRDGGFEKTLKNWKDSKEALEVGLRITGMNKES